MPFLGLMKQRKIYLMGNPESAQSFEESLIILKLQLRSTAPFLPVVALGNSATWSSETQRKITSDCIIMGNTDFNWHSFRCSLLLCTQLLRTVTCLFLLFLLHYRETEKLHLEITYLGRQAIQSSQSLEVQWYTAGRNNARENTNSFPKYTVFLPSISLKQLPNNEIPKSSAAW